MRALRPRCSGWLDSLGRLFDAISAPFKTGRARFPERGLLRLCRGALLLLGLLAGFRILSPAVATRGNCPGRRAGAGIPTDDFADEGAARGAANPGPRGAAG